MVQRGGQYMCRTTSRIFSAYLTRLVATFVIKRCPHEKLATMQHQLWLLGLLALLLLKTGHLLVQQRRLKKLMPPGPPGLPILGNVFQLPQFQWLRFTEWKEQYGMVLLFHFPT